MFLSHGKKAFEYWNIQFMSKNIQTVPVKKRMKTDACILYLYKHTLRIYEQHHFYMNLL